MNDFEHSFPNASVCDKLRTTALVCGSVVAALGGVALVGWILGVQALKGAYAAGVTMKTNTAIGLILLGLGLALNARTDARSWLARVGRILAGGAFLIGVATLIEHLTGANLGIDEALFKEAVGAAATTSPNRMGMPSSITMPILAVAIVLLGARSRRGLVPSQLLATGAILVMLFPLLGYLLNIPSL